MSRFNIDMNISQAIKSVSADSFKDSIKMIDIEKIKPCQENFYEISEIEILADDIERQGLKHNLVVTADKDTPNEYWLKSGHRRLSAIQLLVNSNRLSSKFVPCLIKKYFVNKLTEFDKQQNINGITSFPDNKSDTISFLIILLLIGRIEKLEDIQFLECYATKNDYLNFLFYPKDFDYSKIKTDDYMWCNIINNDTTYREVILQHKPEFWTEDDVKRITLGFGSPFENRVVYKYLFD